MKKSTGALIGGGAVLGLSGAAVYVTARYFFKVAFDARKKLNSNRFGTGTDYEQTINEGRDWLLQYPADIITIESEDGLTLVGHYIPAEKPVRTVILAHGWHGSWCYDFAAQARWLHENGCNLLLIEQRAQGESEGKYVSYGLLESRDLLCWTDWLLQAHPAEKLYLFGISMGAATVLMAEGIPEIRERVDGILADCGFTSPYEMINFTGKRLYKMPEHPLMDLLNRWAKRKVGVDLKEYSTIDAMREATCPVLFVHGLSDTFVPSYMSLLNYEACASDKEILLVRGAGHGLSYLVDTEKYQDAVMRLWNKAERSIGRHEA